jgi:hypothetical protein
MAWPRGLETRSSNSGRQRLAAGDPHLPVDQVEPGHQLGHRVLDLEAGVHLEEVEAAVAASRNSTVPALV